MRVAINGFGRIGRIVFRIMMEDDDIDIVAINDLTKTEDLAYLLKYDTTHGMYKKDVVVNSSNNLVVDGKEVKVYSEKDPSLLPWGDDNIDIVFECTGLFTEYSDAHKHIDAGSRKVIISAPSKSDIKTIVYNVNHDTLDGSEEVISSASCTTNCLAPVLKVIDDNFKIRNGYMTTIHAYTNDQAVLDIPHKKGYMSRRGRACAANIVPSSTGAAVAISKVLPNLEGKMKGSAMRVPVIDGSLVDLVLEVESDVRVEDVNAKLMDSVNETLECVDEPIVSSDVIGSSAGCVVDTMLTDVNKVEGSTLLKVVAWYDNECGYSNQMVRVAKYLVNLNKN